MILKFKAPSPAFVVSCVALLVALGQGVRAAATVGTADIQDKAVTTPKLADEAVTDIKIAPGSVTASKLAANAVTSAAILNNSVTLAKIRGVDVKFTFNLSAGTVPKGVCNTLLFGVAGTKSGEMVLISPQGSVPLQAGVFIYGAQVVTDGHVSALLCNMSGTTQSAISKAIRVVTLG